MNTLTFSFPALNKGDLCTLFFTEEQSKQSFKTDLLEEQIFDFTNNNTEKLYALSHNFQHALTLTTGTMLYNKNKKQEEVIFCVQAIHFHPASAYPVIILKCLSDNYSSISKVSQNVKKKQNFKESFTFKKNTYSLAIITLSDKGFNGKREDRSGPALLQLVGDCQAQQTPLFQTKNLYILPDEIHSLRGLVTSLAYTQGVDCIITTGGTGLSTRDITPNALLPLLQSRLQGFEQAMMTKSLEKTPHAMLSRAFAGIIHKSLLVSVPGSVKAATENIEAILPALPHALAKLSGDMSDCGN